MKKTFYITTPIYYPSGKPHVGHAFSTLLADVLAKYKKLLGYEVFFSTGTDEHGKKLQEAAKKNNMELMDFIDQNVKVFTDLWKALGIEYSRFIRTTNIQHVRTIQKIFEIYYNKGLIYLNDWKSLYCVSCEENITSKDVVINDNKKCCKFGHELIEASESSYFFKMSQFQNWIKETLLSKKDWILPESRVNELVNNFLDNELTDLSISRTSFDWGISILRDPKHVIYVWMDALFNYLTVLDYLQEDDALYQKFWNHDNAEVVHLLSKEITRFHCIYWPIFLHTLDLRLPTKIISHGWIVTNTGKMSKSLGNVIDPFAIIDEYSRDCLRYYLIKDMSLVNDNVFSIDSMLATYNGDLANNIGNLISRTIGMLKKYNDNIIPTLKLDEVNDKEKDFINKINETNEVIVESINDLKPSQILQSIQNLINYANKFIEEEKPWELYKEQKTLRLHQLLNLLSNVVKVCFYWLQPVLIDGIEEASNQFNLDFKQLTLDQVKDISFLNNHQVNQAKPIFVRKEIK